MAPKPQSNKIHVYDGAAETTPCPFGEPLPDLPSNWLLAAPSGQGKTQILLNLALKFYKGMFGRIWIFSPSIKLDPQYKPLRDYLEKMCDQRKEPLMFEELDQSVLGELLETQRKIVEECRKRDKKAPHVLVILDDLGDYSDVLSCRKGGKSGGSWLTTLACRGRHTQVSWICSVQKLNQAGLTVRSNFRNLLVWRLRNHKEIESLCEELNGFYDAKTVLQLYTHATTEAFSFLNVKLDAKTRNDVFWLRFESRLSVKEESDDDGDAGNSRPLGRGSGKTELLREDGPKPRRKPREDVAGPK